MLRVWSYILTDARSLYLAFLTCWRRSIVSTTTFYCIDFRSVLACRTLWLGRFSHSWPIERNKSHSAVSCPASSRFCSEFGKVPYWAAVVPSELQQLILRHGLHQYDNDSQVYISLVIYVHDISEWMTLLRRESPQYRVGYAYNFRHSTGIKLLVTCGAPSNRVLPAPATTPACLFSFLVVSFLATGSINLNLKPTLVDDGGSCKNRSCAVYILSAKILAY